MRIWDIYQNVEKTKTYIHPGFYWIDHFQEIIYTDLIGWETDEQCFDFKWIKLLRTSIKYMSTEGGADFTMFNQMIF